MVSERVVVHEDGSFVRVIDEVAWVAGRLRFISTVYHYDYPELLFSHEYYRAGVVPEVVLVGVKYDPPLSS
jgi:hypothetical protein